ncbi:MAG: hypothetical protein ACK5DL_08945 [Burkholderiales bacterium]|jgi:hypothetical protein|nr:hypothetical protein [Betaproteobacteria bacterium]
MNTALRPSDNIEDIIAKRVYAIAQGHASNLIEGVDVGSHALTELLNLAREPISDEEFTKLALAALHRDFPINA